LDSVPTICVSLESTSSGEYSRRSFVKLRAPGKL
jgi:hypothetical protein